MSFIETKNSQKKDAKKNFIDISIENNSTNKNKNFNKKNNVIIENIINSLDENEIQNNTSYNNNNYKSTKSKFNVYSSMKKKSNQTKDYTLESDIRRPLFNN